MEWQANTRYRLTHPDSGRIYEAMVVQDIFGNWVVEKYGGGRKRKLSPFKPCFVNSRTEGLMKLSEIYKNRKVGKQNGYEFTGEVPFECGRFIE